MPLELIAPKDESGSRLLSNNVKINDTEKFALVKDTVLNLRLSELATDIFIAIGARDYGRIDIRLDASGVPQFLEANLIPSIIEDYGNFPKACLLNKNLSYEKIILQIVDLAFARDVPDDSFVYNAIPVNASK
jgi:D-alanine-D-alanine ligase